MLVEIFLELLICIVNVKLLKTIHLWEETKIFKCNSLVLALSPATDTGRCQAWNKAREHRDKGVKMDMRKTVWGGPSREQFL